MTREIENNEQTALPRFRLSRAYTIWVRQGLTFNLNVCAYVDKSSSIAYGIMSDFNPKRGKDIRSNLNPSRGARLMGSAWFRGVNSNLSHLDAMSTPRPPGINVSLVLF